VLKTKIEGDADAATLTTDCRSIFGGYRILALVGPGQPAHLWRSSGTDGGLK
jgi:hypothetical protein